MTFGKVHIDCRNLLLVVVSIFTLIWTISILKDSLLKLPSLLESVDLGWLTLMLVGNLFSAYFAFETFYGIFRFVKPGAYGRKELAHFHFTSQLMKHLPGRIWGMAYQSAAGSKASVSDWVVSNAIYMLLNLFFAIWIAFLAIGALVSKSFAGVLVLAGLLFFAVSWSRHSSRGLIWLIAKLKIRRLQSLLEPFRRFSTAPLAFKIRTALLLLLSWIVYFFAWGGFGAAWPNLTAWDGMALCALYTAAWFVGYISLLTPSGLGVRELTFVALARDFPPDAVAAIVIIGRVVLLAVDIIFGAAFVFFRVRVSERDQ